MTAATADAGRLLKLAFADRGDEALWRACADAHAEAGDDAAAAFLRWAVAEGLRPVRVEYPGLEVTLPFGPGSDALLPRELFRGLPADLRDVSTWADGPQSPRFWPALLAAWRPLYAAGRRPGREGVTRGRPCGPRRSLGGGYGHDGDSADPVHDLLLWDNARLGVAVVAALARAAVGLADGPQDAAAEPTPSGGDGVLPGLWVTAGR